MGKHRVVNQPSPWPVAKVAASGLGGSAATVLVWAATEVGVDMPVPVAGAIVTLVAFVAGYFKRAAASE